jgi:hypothetical protein
MKMLITILLLSSLTIYRAHAQAIVRDKYKRRQMESMVVTRWGKFIPKWYYILFHNKYRKGEDRRTMRQLLPGMAAVAVTEAQSTKEKVDSDQLFEHALWMEANIEAELPYHLYFEPKFNRLNAEIQALIIKAIAINTDPAVTDTFQSEAARLNGQTAIIRKGMHTNGESSDAYSEIESELIRLKGMIHKYIRHQTIVNKYTRS